MKQVPNRTFVRLVIGGAAIGDRVLGHQLLQHRAEDLELVFVDNDNPDEDVNGVKPEFRGMLRDMPLPLAKAVVWPYDNTRDCVDQMIITDTEIFIANKMYPRMGKTNAKGPIVPVSKAKLRSLQSALLGSGLKLYAYGSRTVDTDRDYRMTRAEGVPELVTMDGLAILGLVNIHDGEITDYDRG